MYRSYSDGTVRRRVRLDNSIRLDASIGRLSWRPLGYDAVRQGPTKELRGVTMGMGEAVCDVASNLCLHDGDSYVALVVDHKVSRLRSATRHRARTLHRPAVRLKKACHPSGRGQKLAKV